MSSSQPPSRRTADPAQTRDELERLRPGMVARYDAALPGARAAILSRLLGAIAREPLPGLTDRGRGTATFAATAAFDQSFAAGAATTHPSFPAAGAATTPSNQGLRAGPSSTAPSNQGLRAGPSATTPTNQTIPSDSATSPPTNPSFPSDGPATAPINLSFPTDAAVAFAHPADGLSITVHDGPRLDDPAALVRLLWGDVPLAAEIANSVANLALARAALPADHLPGDLGRIEQLVVDGHPLHPCCRTRGGMTVDDVLTYAPEHSPVIRLRRLRVPENRWFGTASPLLYAHPWQAEHLRDRYPWLSDDGETEPGRPLMSLRTVAVGKRHLKTAIDVQMTSAVRTVSPAAVTNGPLLSALLEKLTADLPLSILAETAGGAVIVDGEPQRHLAYLERQAPVIAGDELVVPLAAMAASQLLLKTVNDPYKWWGLLCERLFAPLVTVLDRGVALEAHGQNTLVVLKNHRPHRILYRDFGGVRVSGRRLRTEAPPLHGDLPSDDPAELRTKLAASALANAAADLIAAFTRHLGADPARLWRQTAEAIKNTGTSDVPHLLRDPLPVKATTAMRLAINPLDDLWAYLDNPLAAV